MLGLRLVFPSDLLLRALSLILYISHLSSVACFKPRPSSSPLVSSTWNLVKSINYGAQIVVVMATRRVTFSLLHKVVSVNMKLKYLENIKMAHSRLNNENLKS